jgi:hypothetical protein
MHSFHPHTLLTAQPTRCLCTTPCIVQLPGPPSPHPPSIISVPATLRLPTVHSYREPSQARELHLSPLPLVSRMTDFVITNGPMDDLSLPRLIRRSRSRVEMMSKLGVGGEIGQIECESSESKAGVPADPRARKEEVALRPAVSGSS